MVKRDAVRLGGEQWASLGLREDKPHVQIPHPSVGGTRQGSPSLQEGQTPAPAACPWLGHPQHGDGGDLRQPKVSRGGAGTRGFSEPQTWASAPRSHRLGLSE